jgi:hypothetical protein
LDEQRIVVAKRAHSSAARCIGAVGTQNARVLRRRYLRFVEMRTQLKKFRKIIHQTPVSVAVFLKLRRRHTFPAPGGGQASSARWATTRSSSSHEPGASRSTRSTYIALNAVLINELVERVHLRLPAAQRPAAMPDARASAACGDLAGVDRDMCRFESRIGQASGTLREEPREWRAARDATRAGTRSALPGAAVPERAAALR